MEVCELIGSTEIVRRTGFILSFNEYFRTVIRQQSVYCEHKGNLRVLVCIAQPVAG